MNKLKSIGLQNLYVDINNEVIGALHAKEGESNSRGLNIILISNGERLDSRGILVEFYGKARDGEVYRRVAEPVNEEIGNYTLIYPSNMLISGKVEAELVLSIDNSVMITKTFTIHVDRGIVSDDYIEGLDEESLLSKLSEIIDNEEIRKQNELERIEYYEEVKDIIGSGGEIGEGPQGPPGADGLSAYQIWLDEGNEGTEQDFLESLKGPQGPPGKDGSDATVSYDNVINALGFTPANESVIGDINAILDEINGEVI